MNWEVNTQVAEGTSNRNHANKLAQNVPLVGCKDTSESLTNVNFNSNREWTDSLAFRISAIPSELNARRFLLIHP